MTKINSRQKGKTGELELAHYLTDRGYPARRGQQYSGTETSADVVAEGLEDFHLECKRVEAGNLYNWLDQAIRDSAGKKTPIVAHRKSRHEWVAVMRLDDLLNLICLKGC